MLGVCTGQELPIKCMVVNLALICLSDFSGEPWTLPIVYAPRRQPCRRREIQSPTCPSCCTGCLLLPELSACHGTLSCQTPDPAQVLAGMLLGLASPGLLLPACLILLSYAPAHSCPWCCCLRAALSFQLSQYTMQMLRKTARVTQADWAQ